MTDPINFADEEWRHDALVGDDRPRTARRNRWTEEQYEDALGDRHFYDARTGEWS